MFVGEEAAAEDDDDNCCGDAEEEEDADEAGELDEEEDDSEDDKEPSWGIAEAPPAPLDGVVASAEEDSAAEAEVDEVSMGSTFVSNDAETRSPKRCDGCSGGGLDCWLLLLPPFWLDHHAGLGG